MWEKKLLKKKIQGLSKKRIILKFFYLKNHTKKNSEKPLQHESMDK